MRTTRVAKPPTKAATAMNAAQLATCQFSSTAMSRYAGPPNRATQAPLVTGSSRGMGGGIVRAGHVHAGDIQVGGVLAIAVRAGGLLLARCAGTRQVLPGRPRRRRTVGHGGRGVLGDQVPPGRLLAGISGHLAITPVHSLPARLWARTKSRLPAKISAASLSSVATW